MEINNDNVLEYMGLERTLSDAICFLKTRRDVGVMDVRIKCTYDVEDCEKKLSGVIAYVDLMEYRDVDDIGALLWHKGFGRTHPLIIVQALEAQIDKIEEERNSDKKIYESSKEHIRELGFECGELEIDEQEEEKRCKFKVNKLFDIDVGLWSKQKGHNKPTMVVGQIMYNILSVIDGRMKSRRR